MTAVVGWRMREKGVHFSYPSNRIFVSERAANFWKLNPK